MQVLLCCLNGITEQITILEINGKSLIYADKSANKLFRKESKITWKILCLTLVLINCESSKLRLINLIINKASFKMTRVSKINSPFSIKFVASKWSFVVQNVLKLFAELFSTLVKMSHCSCGQQRQIVLKFSFEFKKLCLKNSISMSLAILVVSLKILSIKAILFKQTLFESSNNLSLLLLEYFLIRLLNVI